jgi:hypothetical protein
MNVGLNTSLSAVQLSSVVFRFSNSSGQNSGSLQQGEEDNTTAVEELKARDIEVRKHEAAHLAAAGSLAMSGAHYEYETGPDGKRYAVGGDVQIDVSAISGNPGKTIEKMEQVIRSALAPAMPSEQDLNVARGAEQAEMEAQAQLASKKASAYSASSKGIFTSYFVDAAA